MSAVELIELVSHATWLALALLTGARAVRRPTRASVNIALFFGGLAIVTLVGRVEDVVELPAERLVDLVTSSVVVTLPYLLLRLADDFGGVAVAVRRTAEIGLAIAIAGLVVLPELPAPLALYIVAYFAVFAVYSASSFIRFGARYHGVTRRRMRAVAWGAAFLAMAIVAAGARLILPALSALVGPLTQVVALASSVAFALGFVPPRVLRQSWQGPELRAFLGRASTLPRRAMAEIVRDLQDATARTLGAGAVIALWDERARVLRSEDPRGVLPRELGPSGFLAWRSFSSDTPLYFSSAPRANPEHADAYRRAGVGPVLIAPIRAGERRIGVLEVYAPREPIFAEDDLELVQLFAQQAAVIIESRALIDEAAAVRAQEEAALLKEDFVSAAAHDLRTPLTTIVAQAQLMEQRAQREGRTADLPGIQRLVRETSRLARLVDELLDASRIERGAFPIQPERCDLVEIARAVAGRERSGAERIAVVADGPVAGTYDPDRMAQLIDNLVENALKYGPEVGRVELRVWREEGTSRIAVSDQGIGIPPEDLPHVFERFRRASNVDHRRFAGIGLGLYICRGIVEQHGGRIWAESQPGKGSVFHVALPDPAARPEAAE